MKPRISMITLGVDDLPLESIGVLAAVVAIRTFLSFTLEVEPAGRWPWQAAPDQNGN